MFKKLGLIGIVLGLVVSVLVYGYTKTEQSSTDAASVVLYGSPDNGTTIVTLKTDSNGNLITNSSTVYNDTQARKAISAGAGISYNNTTGVINSTITQYTDALARIALSAGAGISYDNSTGVINNTIVNLDDLSDVSAATPSVNDVISWNGTAWAKSTPTAFTGSGVRTFFLNDTASGVSDYGILAATPTSGTEEFDSKSVNNNETLIESYISPAGGLGHTTWEGGTWEFQTYANVSSITGPGLSQIKIYVYKYAVDTSETELFNTTTGIIGSSTITLYNVRSTQPSFATATTDRLLIKYYANTTQTSNRIVGFVHGGSSRYTTAITPLQLKHNDISGLQGGVAAGRYHVDPSNFINGTGINWTLGANLTTIQPVLQNTTVTPGTYSPANITIDAQGRVTAASNGTAAAVTSYVMSFANGNLSSGVLNLTHGLDQQFLQISIYDNNKQLVSPDDITASNANYSLVNLTSFGTLTGNWNATATK